MDRFVRWRFRNVLQIETSRRALLSCRHETAFAGLCAASAESSERLVFPRVANCHKGHIVGEHLAANVENTLCIREVVADSSDNSVVCSRRAVSVLALDVQAKDAHED